MVVVAVVFLAEVEVVEAECVFVVEHLVVTWFAEPGSAPEQPVGVPGTAGVVVVFVGTEVVAGTGLVAGIVGVADIAGAVGIAADTVQVVDTRTVAGIDLAVQEPGLPSCP